MTHSTHITDDEAATGYAWTPVDAATGAQVGDTSLYVGPWPTRKLPIVGLQVGPMMTVLATCRDDDHAQQLIDAINDLLHPTHTLTGTEPTS